MKPSGTRSNSVYHAIHINGVTLHVITPDITTWPQVAATEIS